ncbi:MAG: hypothetical protein HOP10_05080 [Chitinophagaceae bacterium]|nr:hypothetical protein [Chitinophagaceae bacterium]
MATATNRVIAKTVDDYIASFPADVQTKLQKIRKTIKAAAPKADEMISYGIAGYKYKGMLIYFAGFKNHVSVYPAPRTVEPFKKELAAYRGGKGTVQFPNDEPVPLGLVKRIVQFRLKANEEKAATKKNSKK